MNILNLDLVLLSGLTIALMEMLKMAINSKKYSRFYPLMSVGVGIIIASFLAYSPNSGIADIVITGIVVGATASGVYDFKGLVKRIDR